MLAAQAPVQLSSRSASHVLTTRSTGTPHSTARSHPLPCQSSWPGACASVSIANSQPVSTARVSSRRGGASRSGRGLISTLETFPGGNFDTFLLACWFHVPAWTPDYPSGQVCQVLYDNYTDLVI